MSVNETAVLDLLYGRWRSQTLYAGVKLGIFEAVRAKPRSAVDIAADLELDTALSSRLLRALASLDLLREHVDGHYSVTAAGAVLASDHPHSMSDLVLLREGPQHTAVWKHLPDIVRDGVQDGFVREYGHTAFEHASSNPEYGEAFDAGMSSHSRLQSAWTLEALAGCDLSSTRRVCDVGGGQGHLLCQLLMRYPHLVGTVLDRAAVLKNEQALYAKKLRLEARCTYLAGDMFVDVPASDAYMLKMILHDWNDDECAHLLSNVIRRASSGGRVFIVEHVVGIPEGSDFASLFDMHMMCWGSGRERTAKEYEHLLRKAGWTPAAVWSPPSGAISVIEGRKN